MPSYDFMCMKCEKPYTFNFSIKEYSDIRDLLVSGCCNAELKRIYNSETGILDNCRGFYGRNKS